MLHCNEGWNRMAGGIVSIAQQKGGAGKTTLAVQLGVALPSAGRRVAMLDIDPQASLFAWFNVRRRRFGGENGLLVQGLSGWRLGSELRRLRREFDLIVVDSPPHAESDARAAIREADLALVPCQPNALDVWACGPTLELAEGARTDALLVLNRVPPRPRRRADARRDRGAALALGRSPARQPAGVRRLDRGRPRRRRDGAEQRGRPRDCCVDEVLGLLA